MIKRASKTTGGSIAWMMILLQKKTQKEISFPEMPGLPHQYYNKKEEYISFAEVINNFNKKQIALLVSCTFVCEKQFLTSTFVQSNSISTFLGLLLDPGNNC